MDVAMLRPWRSTNPHRQAIEAWQRQHLANTYPDLTVITAGDGQPDSEPFNISAALNNARSQATTTWLWIMGTDHAPTPADLPAALDAIGDHGWINVYETILQLDEVGTRYTLQGLTTPATWNAYTRRGGALSLKLVHADIWDDIGGFDEAFRGWGYEDMAFHDTLTTLHPPALPAPTPTIRSLAHPRDSAGVLASRNHDYYNATYLAHRGDAAAMRQIVEEKR